MPTSILLEQADAFAQGLGETESACCIYALIWRLKGSEEWIVSQIRRSAEVPK